VLQQNRNLDEHLQPVSKESSKKQIKNTEELLEKQIKVSEEKLSETQIKNSEELS